MADSIQPNFIKQNPDGTVAAVFSGGVELTPADLSKSQQPQAENSVQWIRQADGALVAEVYSQVQDPGGIAGTASTQILTYDPEARGGQLYLSAQQSPTNQDGAASLSVNSGSTGNVGSVTASANDASGNQSFVRVIKGDGSSGFLQLALNGNYKSRIVTGQVTWPGGNTFSNATFYTPSPVPTNGNTFAICSATSDVTSAGAFVGIGLIRGYNEGNYVAFTGQPVNGSSPPAGSICNFAAIVFWQVS